MNLIETVSELVPDYFFEPDVFGFTQKHWELGTSLYGKSASEVSTLLTNSAVPVSDLETFRDDLLAARKFMEAL
jgi:hypothetical protein